jgi:hypothetical protein
VICEQKGCTHQVPNHGSGYCDPCWEARVRRFQKKMHIRPKQAPKPSIRATVTTTELLRHHELLMQTAWSDPDRTLAEQAEQAARYTYARTTRKPPRRRKSRD